MAARFNFNLRNPKSEKATAIHLLIRYDNNKVVFHTGHSIDPKLWDNEKQKTIITNKYPKNGEINTSLGRILNESTNIFLRFENEKNRKPTIEECKKLINENVFDKSEYKKTVKKEEINLYSFTDKLIAETWVRLKTKGTYRKGNTIADSYRQTKDLLKEYSRHKKVKLNYDSIDLDFYYDFIEYMETIKEYSVNNIGKHIKVLKTILNEAFERGYHKNIAYKSKRFKVLVEKVDSIYLNQNELDELYNYNLSENKKLDKVRDLFIVGCWTGLRFSDFTNIRKDNIKGEFIEIETQKTGETVVIPIHWTVKEIITKYNGRLPKAISNVKMNLYLKELGSKIDLLNKKVSLKKTSGGLKVYSDIKKYKLITTHTARRSFATNLYLEGIPSITIMKITGHKTERAFLAYIKITPDENAKILLKHWQEKQKLRVVN